MTPRLRCIAALLLFALTMLVPQFSSAQTIPPIVAYHAATDVQHQNYWNTLRSQGYRIITLSVYGDPANERYAAVWVKRSGPTQAAIHNTNAAGYQSFFNTVTQNGYRPIIVTATGAPASATFAAVFEKSSVPGWFAAHDLVNGADTDPSTIEYNHKWARQHNFIPLSVSRYGNASTDSRYAGIWVYNGNNTAWNYSMGPWASSYQDDFDAFTAMDFRPSCIGVNNGQRYSAVFRDDRIGPYIAYHDLTYQEYQDKFDLHTGQGYYPILVEGAGVGTAARYAGVFAKQESPVARAWKITGAATQFLSSTDTAKFDNAVKSWMQLHGVRAGQFTFMRNGNIAYSRAFTWAEPGYPTTQVSSPMRLASNSKAFTCAAISKLLETHTDLLDKKVFPLLGITTKALSSQTPSSYINDITVQHLVSHKGGWDMDISGFDPVFHCRDISIALGETSGPLSAWNMARFMYGEPLQFVPGSRDAYSNIGYVLLALIVEKLSGKSFEDYVKENVLAADGITDVWLARSAKSQRLPGEGYYRDPSIGLTSLQPGVYDIVPGIYGGHGFLTEPMHGGGGMAATATSMTEFVHHHAVWGLGGRNPGATRTGSMPGSTSLARSREDGADYAFIFNTRWWKAGYVDPVDDLNTALEAIMNNIKPRITGLSFTITKPAGGQSSFGTVSLGWQAPPGGALITLTSSNAAVATVPASITIAAGASSGLFQVTTYPQTSNKIATIKATYNGGSKSYGMTVTPIVMSFLSVVPSSVYGGENATGSIMVYGKAAVDTSITIGNTNSAAHPVGPVVIPAGTSATTFQITTDPVSSNTSGTISASVSGTSKSATFVVKPPVLASLKLTPNPVTGGNAVTGQVAMTGAVAVDTVIQLKNANTKARLANGTNIDTVTVPAGSSSATFLIRTSSTLSPVSGSVTATLGRTSKVVSLTVNP